MITVQLSFNLVVPTNCDPGIITLVQCIANIVTSSNLTASLTTVLKFAASLEGRATVTADINFVQKVASSLNANASLVSDINFVQKVQASLLTSANVTGDITIPQLLNASLLATGTTTADLTVNAPSASLLLDLYPSAAAAYSLRKLRAAYTGSAIRVRRSSDNTEQDIGFTGNDLNTTALTTFVGAGNGFVTTWYDQSGNALNATQTIQANQPQIVNSGIVITDNAKSAVKFDGTNDKMIIGQVSDFDYSGALSYFTTLGSHTNLANDFLGNRHSTLGLGFVYIYRISASRYLVTNLGVANTTLTTNLLSKHIASGIRDNLNAWTLFINNNAGTPTGTFTYNTGTNSPLTIGADGNSGGFFNGNAFEYIFYKSNQSANRTGIQTNINTYYAIY